MFALVLGGGPNDHETLLPNTPLPLATSSLRPAHDGIGRFESVTLHHLNRYEIELWSGTDVSSSDRATTDRLVASIRPWAPPLPAANFGRCVGGWAREPVPSGPLQARVSAIDSLSPTDGWAVGSYRHVLTGVPTPSPAPLPGPPTASTGLALHWDGNRWHRVEPDPDVQLGTNGVVYGASSFRDVAEIAPDDVWAVGSDGQYGLTEHWDGSRWSVVPSPKIFFTNGTLVAVDGSGPDDMWAVASGGERGEAGIIEHWDGRRWALSPIPEVAATYTTAEDVSAYSDTDAWVVGHALALHWDGTAWRSVPTAEFRAPRLSGVVDLGPGGAWVVGTTQGTVQPLIEHWDGKRWTLAELPSLPTRVSLEDVSASGQSDVWALGWGEDAVGTETQIVLHYDGARWSSVPPPVPTLEQGSFGDVSASAAGAWLVGSDGSETAYRPDRPFLARSCG